MDRHETRSIRTRVHGPRRILQELRRLLTKNRGSLEIRTETDEERKWSAPVHDALGRLIEEGDQVLPILPDRRDHWRVRKRAAHRGGLYEISRGESVSAPEATG